jgi:hypothetical protein
VPVLCAVRHTGGKRDCGGGGCVGVRGQSGCAVRGAVVAKLIAPKRQVLERERQGVFANRREFAIVFLRKDGQK